jgi:hypothetical protein
MILWGRVDMGQDLSNFVHFTVQFTTHTTGEFKMFDPSRAVGTWL